MKNFFKKTILIFSGLGFLFAQPSQAALLSLEASAGQIRPGSFWEVTLVLDSQGEYINALEGEVYFPADILQLSEVRLGDSIVNFWLEDPRFLTDGQVVFSGITPGGFAGQGNVLRLFFKAKKDGEGALEIKSARLLLNDGLGTALDFKTASFPVVISASAPERPAIKVELADIDPPEIFTPMITKIPEIYGDKYVLIFSTQDKGSGMNYFQIKEGSRWPVKAVSPYVLKNQKLNREIVVKAVDKAGNERKVVIAPSQSLRWYENYWIFAIIVLVSAGLYLISRRRWVKKIK
ncbi:MAG: cohesin domain-containing protein [Patescibacteria group bacterium]|nr:cohesin domain-containing protein [Patescibacteria group bacterium]